MLDHSAKGIILLVNDDARFERTVTVGDLRRLLLSGKTLDDDLEHLPRHESVVLQQGYTKRQALEIMSKAAINHIPVLDDYGRPIDLIERSKIDEQVLLSTPHMGDAEIEYVVEAFRTNWIAPLGPNVDAFERELAASIGARHAVALSSGTAAIHIALLARCRGGGCGVLFDADFHR